MHAFSRSTLTRPQAEIKWLLWQFLSYSHKSIFYLLRIVNGVHLWNTLKFNISDGTNGRVSN